MIKLSKKITVLFVCTFIVTVGLYIVLTDLLANNFYGGEDTRISGITSGCINRVEGELSRITGKCKEYSSSIGVYQELRPEFSLDEGISSIKLEQKFSRDEIDYKLIMDENLNIVKFFDYSLKSEEDSGYEEAITTIKNIIKREKKQKGLIGVGEKLYYFSYENIKLSYDGEDGYFIVLEPVTKEAIASIGDQMGKKAYLEETIKESINPTEDVTVSNGKVVSIVKNENSVDGYYKFDILEGNNFYLRVVEPLVVKESTLNNSIKLAVLFVAINLIVNAILLMIMKNIFVKKIESVSEGINEIKINKDLSRRIKVDKSYEEIYALSKNINDMCDALEESNRLFRENEEKSSKLLEGLENGYLYFSEVRNVNGEIVDGRILDYNESICRLLNISKHRLNVESFMQIFSEKIKDKEVPKKILRDLSIKLSKVELENNLFVSISVYQIENGHFAMLLTDITENINAEEEMRFLANYDVLTGLQNRYSLYKLLDEIKDKGHPFDIYYIDLDNFKSLNDSLGHSSGDEVLCQAADSLRTLGEGVNVARLGGDEFLVIKEVEKSEIETKAFGDIILKSLTQTFVYKNFSYELKASIGTSSFPSDSGDIENLVRYADIAMYKSKELGGNNVVKFDSNMLDDIVIEGLLKKAIIEKEITPFYQPIYSLETNEIVGAEALARWNNKELLLSTDKFIPIAKKSGDIYEIDNYILKEACYFCKRMIESGRENFKVSVNASYRFLKQHNFIEKLKAVLEETKLNANALKLEITEDEVIDDEERILKILKEIKDLGVLLALDDFGVGYSSFNYIKILPLDTIKIDRSLLLQVEGDSKSLAIITTVINLAHILNLDVIVEGVEVKEQIDLLMDLGCNKIQGYYISKPVNEEKFIEVVKNYS